MLNVGTSQTSDKRVVVVTGASRGIGKATALALAAAGHDLVLTARSIHGGLAYRGTSSRDDLAGEVLPGSVDEVARQCSDLGVQVEPVAMDLTDDDSVRAVARHALSTFGRVDTYISNAIYQGPGINDRFDDLDIDTLRTIVNADAIAPLILLKELLPSMLESGRGIFVHVTSGTATLVPRAAAGEGGWGVAYAMAKGSAHRFAGVLNVEYSARGFRSYNLNPGHVTTDAMILRAERTGAAPTGQSPDIPARAIAWLVDDGDDARELAGQEVVAREVVQKFSL